MEPIPAPAPGPTPKHKHFVPHIPRNNDMKRRRMRGVISNPEPTAPCNSSNGHEFQNDNPTHYHSTIPTEASEAAIPPEKVPARKEYSWHRQQPMHARAKSDDSRMEGHHLSRPGFYSEAENSLPNGGQFNNMCGVFLNPQQRNFNYQRDSCYRLWKQLDAAFEARERHICLKEEELAKREHTVRTQEQFIAHLRAQAQAEKMEAAYIRQEALTLKEQAYGESCKVAEEAKRLESIRPDLERMRTEIVSAGIASELGEVTSINNDGGQTCNKLEKPQTDFHSSEKIAVESGNDATKKNDRVQSLQCMGERAQNHPITLEKIAVELGNDATKKNDRVQSLQCMGERAQNHLLTLENDAGQNLQSMGGSSQSCLVTSQVKLDTSGNNHEHSMEAMELCEVSTSKMRNFSVSEKDNVSVQLDFGVPKEIVNGALEKPGACALNKPVIEDSEALPSEMDKVDYYQHDLRVLSIANDNSSASQPSMQSDEGNKTRQLPAFKSLLHVEALKNEEAEFRSSNAEGGSLPVSAVATSPIKVKVESFEHEQLIPFVPVMDNSASVALPSVNVKSEFFEDYETDVLDHLSLQERQKLYQTSKLELADVDGDVKFPQTESLKAGQCDSGEAWKQEPRNISSKRNKKKTKTCSVETALEEDAPGLLQVLREKGFIDEIKLYGDFVDDDLLGLAPEQDNFEELQNVIEKLWGRPSGLIKMARMRQIVASKPTYCLACLVSLIEQTRSLQLRKWPVEWGWCRQLQSFIFVFERHNRIVLERPEYGYATYFFELVQSLPIKWQVGRLVTVMSIAICSRAALLENRPLEVGQDLTSEEASILEDYGWTPNSGFGSLLNYCDRVVHDRKNDDDDMEWRTKIGKLLMDGHARGRISMTNIPRKLQNIVSAVKSEEYE